MIDTKTAENTYNSTQHAIIFLRLEPTLSTTPPDMVMWGPWDSCMKRSALWTSKIRCLHLSLSLSLSLSHTHTLNNHNHRERTDSIFQRLSPSGTFSPEKLSYWVHTSLLPIGNLQLLWLLAGLRFAIVWNNCWLFVDCLTSQWSALSQANSRGKVLLSLSGVPYRIILGVSATSLRV